MRKIVSRLVISALLTLLMFVLPAFSIDTPYISVNGDNIFADEYNYALSRYIHLGPSNFGDFMDSASIKAMKKVFIEDLMEKQIYVQESLRRDVTAKLYAPEEEIDELMMEAPLFMTDGVFDREKYLQLTSGASMEVKKIRERAEHIILACHMRDVLPSRVIQSIKTDVSPESPLVLREYAQRAERMRVKYVKIDPYEMIRNMFVTEDEIKGYYQEHKEVFKRPGYKKYVVMSFDPEAYMDMVTITDSMVNEYYLKNPGDFMSEDKAKIRYVLFRTKEYLANVFNLGVNTRKYYDENIEKFIEPAAARVRMMKIMKPCDVAKLDVISIDVRSLKEPDKVRSKYSDDPEVSFEDLGNISEGSLKEPFNKIAFSLYDKEVSSLVETPTAYYYIFVEEKKDKRQKPFDEVKYDLEEQFLEDEAKPYALADARRFRIEAFRAGFDEAAKMKNRTVYETEYITPRDRLPMFGLNTLFTYTAFETLAGQVSPVCGYEEGYLVLIPAEKLPGQQLAFSDVEDKIRSKLMEENSGAYALSSAKHALDQYKSGVPLETIRAKMNVRVTDLFVSPTIESRIETGVIGMDDGVYSISFFIAEDEPYIPELKTVSEEVMISLAMDKAEKRAIEKADAVILKGVENTEGNLETPLFTRDDYMIGKEYMRPFIEQSFLMEKGESKMIKSQGKYYVVNVLDRAMDIPGYEDVNYMIKSMVLKEKRQEYLKEWIKKERQNSDIKVNI